MSRVVYANVDVRVCVTPRRVPYGRRTNCPTYHLRTYPFTCAKRAHPIEKSSQQGLTWPYMCELSRPSNRLCRYEYLSVNEGLTAQVAGSVRTRGHSYGYGRG